MAKRAKKTASKKGKPTKSAKAAKANTGVHPVLWLRKWLRRFVLFSLAVFALGVAGYAVLNPPTTPYIIAERMRLGWVDHQWVAYDEIAPVMVRSVVAAEDANFCQHWGFDMRAIRLAIDHGANRGASTISQQTVKNTYLWQGRSWPRKALEAVLTPAVELVWTKRRILEVYLNVIEFDKGVFGVEAASRHYFGIGPEKLTPTQAARLAAVLPNPKERSAAKPSTALRKRAASILDGAATIRRDGRAACFED
ncbi:monofunctional biosynthetic peptidoglycan transglycosylase [Aliiroseovarius lamellibrachiae]|uniref:monofunctional biosynthetic peptidoglycan transglycosylase n=1 Tax=Aliiroseovarius lamellibrachiae TaxID=1924933 RepID=UPI001BDFFE09|nr:monofunctional biosynthetic peptidoglycan transglycosylase [Aliiroseovarius lamellibrachiae]